MKNIKKTTITRAISNWQIRKIQPDDSSVLTMGLVESYLFNLQMEKFFGKKHV